MGGKAQMAAGDAIVIAAALSEKRMAGSNPGQVVIRED
jgi:hypothetical protein